MHWKKIGRIYCPDGAKSWAAHSFMTPVPFALSDDVIRVFGGMRDKAGISRIGWIDVDSRNPLEVLAISEKPALDLGAIGMFDDNGVILGDVIRLPDGEWRMYYVGFQLVEKIKFLAFTGLAVSRGTPDVFERVQCTPVLDRAPQAPFINALHSIEASDQGYRAWISCGQRWQNIEGSVFPQYNCWTITSSDGIHFDMENAVPILDVGPGEYRIGRPRVSRRADGRYELRVTSDSLTKQYGCFLAFSDDGITFERTASLELPRGTVGDWDSEMTCYPARLDTAHGDSFLFYNGNGMGRTGVGVAKLA